MLGVLHLEVEADSVSEFLTRTWISWGLGWLWGLCLIWQWGRVFTTQPRLISRTHSPQKPFGGPFDLEWVGPWGASEKKHMPKNGMVVPCGSIFCQWFKRQERTIFGRKPTILPSTGKLFKSSNWGREHANCQMHYPEIVRSRPGHPWPGNSNGGTRLEFRNRNISSLKLLPSTLYNI